MGFLLDFHYSDYWADPGKQIKPAAWVNDDLAAAVTHLHDYTFMAIQALVAAGARPDMVQIGNEITPGILLSPGTPSRTADSSGWPALAQLLNAGIQAVHEVDPTIKIMLHIDQRWRRRRARRRKARRGPRKQHRLRRQRHRERRRSSTCSASLVT